VQDPTIAPEPLGATPPPAIGNAINAGGQPLDASLRGVFEQRFGADFSRVRIHADPGAAAAAASLGARAFTFGSHIAFGHDAWLLAMALREQGGGDLTELRIDGATGRLSFDADGRTRRELDWAQVRGGSARLLTAKPD